MCCVAERHLTISEASGFPTAVLPESCPSSASPGLKPRSLLNDTCKCTCAVAIRTELEFRHPEGEKSNKYLCAGLSGRGALTLLTQQLSSRVVCS